MQHSVYTTVFYVHLRALSSEKPMIKHNQYETIKKGFGYTTILESMYCSTATGLELTYFPPLLPMRLILLSIPLFSVKFSRSIFPPVKKSLDFRRPPSANELLLTSCQQHPPQEMQLRPSQPHIRREWNAVSRRLSQGGRKRKITL